jgi:cell cycle sensor histidine kinase DivJ
MCALADLRHGATFRRVELRLRSPGSNDRHKACDYRPFSVEMMRPTGAELITAVVRANDEVAGLRTALAASSEAAQSIEFAKGRFLASVSHELRTPLNAIIGFSDMLLHEMFGRFQDPRQKEYVGLVRESGHHLLAVVNSILDVSKIESGAYATNPEPFRFREAVEMCRSMMCFQASAKNLDFAVTVAPEIGEINADRRAVQQMLINLVSNAIKFTPDGGSVAIGAKRIGSRLHFWVSDTGIGISADDLSHIGKPFMQVQNDYTRRFEGAGLGLSLVKGLVSLHDGTMAIESELGGGTMVTISLPVSGPTKQKSLEPAEIVAIPENRSKEENDGTFRKTA